MNFIFFKFQERENNKVCFILSKINYDKNYQKVINFLRCNYNLKKKKN